MQQLNAHNSTERERERDREGDKQKAANCSGKVFAEKLKKVSLGQQKRRTSGKEKQSLPCSLATFTFSPLAKVKEQRDVYAIFEAQTKGIYTHTQTHTRIYQRRKQEKLKKKQQKVVYRTGHLLTTLIRFHIPCNIGAIKMYQVSNFLITIVTSAVNCAFLYPVKSIFICNFQSLY